MNKLITFLFNYGEIKPIAIPSVQVSPKLLQEYLNGMPESDVKIIEDSFNDRYKGYQFTQKGIDEVFVEHIEDKLYNWHWCDVCSAHYAYDEPCEFH